MGHKIMSIIESRKLWIILFGLLTSFESHAYLSSTRIECEILQSQEVNKKGYQIPTQFIHSYDKGSKFTVSRDTGLILGKDVSTEGWENQVIGKGLDGKNSFFVLATAKTFSTRKGETNGTWFLEVETYRGDRNVPFFLRTSMGILISGLCN